MTTPKPSIDIFFSYSHKDEELRNELAAHLSVLRRQGIIREWHDRKIVAGEEWNGKIGANLDAAGIILLLVSSDFLYSNSCYDVEMTRALERHEKGEARVIPIIVRACEWQDAPFSKLQALPKDAKPVKSWQDRDEAWKDVATGIRRAVEELQIQRSP
jgi:hypothetical protein